MAEYMAEFRTDIESFVSFDVVEACAGDHVELPPFANLRYFGFCDPSGGSSDSFTLAVSHADGERVVIDALGRSRRRSRRHRG